MEHTSLTTYSADDGINKMTVKPIKPSEVTDRKRELIPGFVIEAFNELIAKNFSGGRAVILQDKITKLIQYKYNQRHRYTDRLSSQDIIDNKWLDIEDIYRKAGWIVEYDSPAYNESYPCTFTFSKK